MRALWIGLGLCFAIVLLAEVLYRVQADIRARLRPPVNEVRAHATPLEARVMAETRRSGEHLAWRPYVYYRRTPFHGEFVNVDSLGARRTQGPEPAGHPVLVFGGAQLWGAGLADSLTVPSLLATALPARGVPGAVVNLAEREYTFTQQLMELMLDLRAGARPSAVVFCNGPDDVSAALANGRAGLTRNEVDRRRDFDVGARLYAWRSDLVSDARAFATLARIAAGRLQLLRRFRPGPRVATASDLGLADDVAKDQLATMELIDALGRRFHFAPLYVWMPEPHTTTAEYSAVFHRATEALARGAATRAPARFLDLSKLAVAAPDDWGRLPLPGSRAVADTLAGFVRLQLAGMRDHQ